ncbi:hypothetical protein ACKWTF_013422 [Chironomus riparius]
MSKYLDSFIFLVIIILIIITPLRSDHKEIKLDNSASSWQSSYEYSVSATKLNKKDFTYSFYHESPELRGKCQRVSKEVASVFGRNTPLTFREAKPNEISDISISFVNKTHPEIDSHKLGGKVIAHAILKGDKCEIHLDQKIRWDFDSNYERKNKDGYICLYTVVLHQFGHCLGLGHTTSSQDVMYDFYSEPHKNLGQLDKRVLQFLYGFNDSTAEASMKVRLIEEDEGSDFYFVKDNAEYPPSENAGVWRGASYALVCILILFAQDE